MLLSRIGHGLAAGAAGVTTLNAITYLDMALRARPSSGAPGPGSRLGYGAAAYATLAALVR